VTIVAASIAVAATWTLAARVHESDARARMAA